MKRITSMVAACFLSLGAASLAIDAIGADKQVRLVAPNALGERLYTVNLNLPSVEEVDASDEAPARDTRDARNLTDFRGWHKPKVRKLVKKFEAEYRITARSMTSYTFPTFTAYMPQVVVDALRHDSRVEKVIEVYEAEDFSAWADRTDGVENVSWGKIAIGTDDGTTGAGTVAYVIDGGAAAHNDLPSRLRAAYVPPSGNSNVNQTHATHVAGIIAASLNNSMVRGVIPGALLSMSTAARLTTTSRAPWTGRSPTWRTGVSSAL